MIAKYGLHRGWNTEKKDFEVSYLDADKIEIEQLKRFDQWVEQAKAVFSASETTAN